MIQNDSCKLDLQKKLYFIIIYMKYIEITQLCFLMTKTFLFVKSQTLMQKYLIDILKNSWRQRKWIWFATVNQKLNTVLMITLQLLNINALANKAKI